MNRLILMAAGVMIAWALNAQTNRYAVFFTDKGGDSYPYTLDKPSDFMSERAIERREKQNIQFNETDLPVSPEYREELENTGVDVYFTSKWLNAAIVQTDESMVATMLDLRFVDSVALIAEGEKLSRDKMEVEIPEEFEKPSSVNATTELQVIMLQADVMHREGYHGEGLLIAVLDNGFRGVNKYKPFEHLWANDQIVAHRDFVENSGNVFRLGGHGTSVFSTIAAKYNGEFSGTAWGADFILCVTEENGSEDRIEEFNWLLGAEFADSLGADIINASLGYRMFDIKEHNYDYEDLDGNTTVVSRAAKLASERGILVVVSAGNHGDNPPNKWRYITPPADVAGVLTVGSVNPDFTWTPFSSLGPTSDDRIKPDVSAMGLGTTIVRDNGSISRGNGTSFSAPQLAGFAAGIWQANPSWTNLEVIEAIRSAGHKIHDPDTLIGNGVPSYAYINGKSLSASDILNEKVFFYPNPFEENILKLKVEEGMKGRINLEIRDSEGKLILEKSIKTSKSASVHEISVDAVEEGLYFLSLQYDDQKKIVKLINF